MSDRNNRIGYAAEQLRKARDLAQRKGQYNGAAKSIIDAAERLAHQAGVATRVFDATAEVKLETIATGGEVEVRLPGDRRIMLTILPGTTDGTVVKIKLDGKDVKIGVFEAGHNIFRREGPDLHRDLVVEPSVLRRGGEANVDTLTGTLALRIAAGTETGTKVRLAGQGLPFVNEQHRKGDLYVTIRSA